MKTVLEDPSDLSLGLISGLETLPRARQACEGRLSGMRTWLAWEVSTGLRATFGWARRTSVF